MLLNSLAQSPVQVIRRVFFLARSHIVCAFQIFVIRPQCFEIDLGVIINSVLIVYIHRTLQLSTQLAHSNRKPDSSSRVPVQEDKLFHTTVLFATPNVNVTTAPMGTAVVHASAWGIQTYRNK